MERIYHHLDFQHPFVIMPRYSHDVCDEFYGDVHYDLQICIVLSGAQEILYNNFRTLVLPGQFWLTSCWEQHWSNYCRKRTSCLVITVSPEMLGDPDIFHEGNWLVPFFVEPSKRPNSKSVAMRLKIHQIGREIKRLAKHHPYCWQTRIWLKIHELVILMIEEWDWKHKVAPINNHMRILPAIQFLRNNINKNISVEDAAKICSMSRSRFSALFTATIGKSFANFSLNARISEAAKKLRTSNLPIKMIAQQCGFSDISHFYRVFKKFFKCTPVEYRAGK